MYQGPGLVAWEAICQPKSTGGLGFRNVSAWNKAAMGKYLWAIANKEDSLWLRWINSVYLHNGDWWDHIPPSQSSWYWISLMRLKEQFKIALNGNLVLQKYTVDYGYKLLNPVQEKVFWNKQIWGRLNTPKHSFVAWLAIQHRLKTRDRLCKMGIFADHGCLLCKEQPETSMHLFFECAVSRKCLQQVKEWLQWKPQSVSLSGLIRWLGRSKMSNFRKLVIAAPVASLIYHIWKMRNLSYWDDETQDDMRMCKELKAGVTQRVELFWPKKVSNVDKEWFMSLL
ncbi:uncharacterized protein LOC115695099 [Cannabis sativa]|uniref:Reverse transcriptase zinc-binding domain-containing protein n=1 Tax=Cannabis sativa TaxID=3483 RepID=A0A803QCI8_CANSA|nr:uncharacterized protein LOC115695099 [Cannabis sativa]